MINLSGLYKNLIILLIILGAFWAPNYAYSAGMPDTPDTVIPEEADYLEESSFDSNTAYINDIEILGSNIIKPEYILSKM